MLERNAPSDVHGDLGPLDGSRIPDRARLAARTTGPVAHACRIETYSCVTSEGASAPQPSLVLLHAPEYEFLESSPRRARVRFEYDGAHVRAQVHVAEGASFAGLGARPGGLWRNGTRHLLWNTDAYAYGLASEALYQSLPFVLAVHADGSATGMLFDSIRRGTISCARDGVEATFEAEPFDVHLIDADHPAEVARGLAAMIGTTPRLPHWALGYHQCRYSYLSAREVHEIASRMRAEGVPCDAIWLDIDYMDRHRPFTWDAERFPAPSELTDELRDAGFRTVAILDPGIADDASDDVLRAGERGGHFVLRPDGRPAGGRVWPGVCRFPDFTRAETRAWWAELVARFVTSSGLDGIWCDMNEPALLGAPTRTLAEDAVHRGEPSGSHARVHNLYGHLMAEATREGLAAAKPGARPFVLTRAAHLRTAAVAATWTGDNQAHWDDLRWSIPMVLNLGLSGQPVSGPDLGGFSGDPDEELFVRWFELGAYLPFCRGHAEKGTCRKEPWSFGAHALAEVRAALQRRMRLMPTFVTVLDEAHRTGVPLCRPVFFADPADARLREVEDAFLLGADLLVAPIVRPGKSRRHVVLPRGGWYVFPGGGLRIDAAEAVVAAPRGTTPVFARAGSIVFEGAVRPHAGAPDVDRTWHVFLDAGGEARGRLVEDDGAGPSARGALEVVARRSGRGTEIEVLAEGDNVARARTILVHDGTRTRELRDDALGSVLVE